MTSAATKVNRLRLAMRGAAARGLPMNSGTHVCMKTLPNSVVLGSEPRSESARHHRAAGHQRQLAGVTASRHARPAFSEAGVSYPLQSGNPAIVGPESLRPVTLRPRLSLGLPLT